METAIVTGEYHLQGAHEMASGFLLGLGGEFQFFFSYGALDRYGSGKWKLEENRVILNSAEQPPYDFALVESKTGPAGTVTIRIMDNNPHLRKYVYCSLDNGADHSWQPMNENGEIQFQREMPDTVCLLFEFCAERFSVIPVVDKTRNDLSFRFEPWIAEVFFRDFALELVEGGMQGKHPLMEGEKYSYDKQ